MNAGSSPDGSVGFVGAGEVVITVVVAVVVVVTVVVVVVDGAAANHKTKHVFFQGGKYMVILKNGI